MLPIIDAYTPRDIAHKIETLGVTKARSDTVSLLVLAVLAGACIALGALFFTMVVTRSALGFGVSRLIGGVAFSLGLILVIVGGAGLFTGNILVAMAWASRHITRAELLRTRVLVYVGNAVGALGTVALVLLGRVHQVSDGAVRDTVLTIGRTRRHSGSWRPWHWECYATLWSVFSTAVEAATTYALHLARSLGARVTLLHVVPESDAESRTHPSSWHGV
jgi:formate/nitrite transporter FocA (FNT family)